MWVPTEQELLESQGNLFIDAIFGTACRFSVCCKDSLFQNAVVVGLAYAGAWKQSHTSCTSSPIHENSFTVENHSHPTEPPVLPLGTQRLTLLLVL